MEAGRTLESCCVPTSVVVALSPAVAAREQSWTIPVPSDRFEPVARQLEAQRLITQQSVAEQPVECNLEFAELTKVQCW